MLPAVLGEVMGNGGQGGLSAIVAKLQQAGFGDQVKSWIGTGQNLPITAEQLQQVLGSDTAKQLAARFNIPLDQLSRFWRKRFPRRWTVRARTAPFRRLIALGNEGFGRSRRRFVQTPKMRLSH